jgi:hypothetical protein
MSKNPSHATVPGRKELPLIDVELYLVMMYLDAVMDPFRES